MDVETRALYAEYIEKWYAGIENEVRFWNDFIGTKGGAWPHDFKRRIDPAPPFAYGELPELPVQSLEALDVGAGPISDVGIARPNGNVILTACDALAPIYDVILRRHNITPYVRTEFALVERLTERYGPNRFDVVSMRNALDHTFQAIDGLLELFNVVKVGGQVLLAHAENEGEGEVYNGFHQWNITADGDELIIWRKDNRVNVKRLLGDCASISNTWTPFTDHNGNQRRYIHTKIIKLKSFAGERSQLVQLFDELLLTTVFRMMSATFRELERS